MTRRPTAGRTLSQKDPNRATNRSCLPPAIAARSKTSGAWLTTIQIECATATDQKGSPPPGDHHQRVEGRVEDRHEGEEDREGKEGARAGPPG